MISKLAIRRLFQFAFWSALIFALVMANLPQSPGVADLNDKSLHMLAFAVLAGLVAFAYPSVRYWVLFLGLALFGALIEWTQLFMGQGRQASLDDWIADIIATGWVLAVIAALRLFWRFWRQ